MAMHPRRDVPPGFIDALADIDAIVARAEANLEQATALQTALGSLTVTRRSPGREVEVTLNSDGRLADIVFTAKAQDCTPALLTRIILTTVRSAMDEIGARAEEVLSEVGQDGPASARIRAEYEHNLAAPLARYRGSDAIRQT